MSYNNLDIEKMLKAMALVTTGSGMNIDKLVDLYTSDAPEATSEYNIKLEHLNFMRNHIIGGKLKITEENAEALLEQDPNCFQGIKVEFIDCNDKDYFDEEGEADGQ
jgi:hypothetical protein